MKAKLKAAKHRCATRAAYTDSSLRVSQFHPALRVPYTLQRLYRSRCDSFKILHPYSGSKEGTTKNSRRHKRDVVVCLEAAAIPKHTTAGFGDFWRNYWNLFRESQTHRHLQQRHSSPSQVTLGDDQRQCVPRFSRSQLIFNV